MIWLGLLMVGNLCNAAVDNQSPVNVRILVLNSALQCVLTSQHEQIETEKITAPSIRALLQEEDQKYTIHKPMHKECPKHIVKMPKNHKMKHMTHHQHQPPTKKY